MRIEINPEHPEPRKIERAAQAIRDGGVIAYPTDTVYGLGCAMSSRRGVESLYLMKQMRKEQALAILVPDLSSIARFAMVQDFHYRFIKRLVPGPYVFIMEATREVPRILMMKRKTIGIRVPAHPVTQALLRALDEPLISTTASHPSDGPEALQDPDDIDARFGMLSVVLDAGMGGVHPSTVLDLTKKEPTLGRAGAGLELLEELFGMKPVIDPEAFED